MNVLRQIINLGFVASTVMIYCMTLKHILQVFFSNLSAAPVSLVFSEHKHCFCFVFIQASSDILNPFLVNFLPDTMVHVFCFNV